MISRKTKLLPPIVLILNVMLLSCSV